jgi:predicted site-specific integrase-resolvase
VKSEVLTDDPLLNTYEVIKRFRDGGEQISRSAVWLWGKSGRLAAVVTPGGHHRYPLSAVEALLDEIQLYGHTRKARPVNEAQLNP